MNPIPVSFRKGLRRQHKIETEKVLLRTTTTNTLLRIAICPLHSTPLHFHHSLNLDLQVAPPPLLETEVFTDFEKQSLKFDKVIGHHQHHHLLSNSNKEIIPNQQQHQHLSINSSLHKEEVRRLQMQQQNLLPFRSNNFQFLDQ